MATVNNISLELALNELKSLVEIFTDAAQNDEKRIELESGKLSLPKMNNTNKIIKFLNKNLISKSRLSKKLYGEDLHKYLLSLVIRYEPRNNIFPKNYENNFDTLIEFLQEKGKKILMYSRHIGELWYSYKRLENLGISLEEFYKRINEIKSLMNTHSNIAAYWRSDEDTNLTSEVSNIVKIE